MSIHAVGTVTLLVGEAKAVSPDGSSRLLQVGDRVSAKEVIVTTAGAMVQIHLEDNRLFEIGPDATIILDESTATSGMTESPIEPPAPDLFQSASVSKPDSAVLQQTESNEVNSTEHKADDHSVIVLEQATGHSHIGPDSPERFATDDNTASTDNRNPLATEGSFLIADSQLLGAPLLPPERNTAAPRDSRQGNAQEGAEASPQIENSAASIPAEALRVGEVLQGLDEGGDLGAYLHFAYDPQNDATTVSVRTTPGEAHKIVLAGVDLTAGGALSADAIIQNLLAANRANDDS